MQGADRISESLEAQGRFKNLWGWIDVQHAGFQDSDFGWIPSDIHGPRDMTTKDGDFRLHFNGVKWESAALKATPELDVSAGQAFKFKRPATGLE